VFIFFKENSLQIIICKKKAAFFSKKLVFSNKWYYIE